MVAFGTAHAQEAAGLRIDIETGIEFRLRAEALEGGDFPSAEGGARLLWRAMPRAEADARPLRGVIQLIATGALSSDLAVGPVDDTGIEVLQAYGELHLPAGEGELALAAGRLLIGLGSERLVGTRWGANVPRAFGGWRANITSPPWTAAVFDLRPLAPGDDDFDDRRSGNERLRGIYATLHGESGNGVDMYLLDHRDDGAGLAEVNGDEQRLTHGLRVFGRSGRWEWNWEAMLQRGSIASADIRAWSLASETTYAISGPLKPVLRLRANIASGDRKAEDGVVGTFDAMYPKAKYFGELTPLGPSNIMNLHGTVAMQPAETLTVSLSASAYWRHRREDGLHDLAGGQIREGGPDTSRSTGRQFELVAEWAPNEAWSFSASASVFHPGAFLAETGASRPMTLVGIEANLVLCYTSASPSRRS